MKIWKTALLVLSGAGLYSVANYSAEVGTFRPRKRVLEGKRFWIVAHRGYSGLYPENTMLAFEKAAELPIDAIELDVHSTRDGKIVVIHDPTLDRTTDHKGRVSDMSWDDLKKVDAGYHFDPYGNKDFPFRGKGIGIPLLEDVFRTFPNLKLIIEIKQTMPAIEDSVYRLIRKYKMEERVIVASEHLEPLVRLRQINPSIATNLAKKEAEEFYRLFRLKLSNFYRCAGDALQIPERHNDKQVVTRESVEAAHRKGLAVHIWTVNDPLDMQRLIDCGVDGIITDFPDRLLRVAGGTV